jgi:hypothetical protein
VASLKVTVIEYAPVRSASVASMCCLNVIVTLSLDTGAAQADFENSTPSADGSENAPFVRCPGSDTVSVASPAVEMTLASVVAV